MKGLGSGVKVATAILIGLTLIAAIFTAVDQGVGQSGDDLNNTGMNASECINDTFDDPSNFNGSSIFEDEDGIEGGC